MVNSEDSILTVVDASFRASRHALYRARDLAESGFRLKEEVYLEAIRKAREIDQPHT